MSKAGCETELAIHLFFWQQHVQTVKTILGNHSCGVYNS